MRGCTPISRSAISRPAESTTPSDTSPQRFGSSRGPRPRDYESGTALLRARRLDEAAERLSEAVRIKPRFSEAHNNLGAVRFLQGKSEEAIRLYEEALRLDADNAEAHFNLGRALAAGRQLPDAIRTIAAPRIRPDSAETHASLASALVAAGNVEEAVGHYRRALEIDPDLLAALADLAWILASTDQGVRDPQEALPAGRARHPPDRLPQRHRTRHAGAGLLLDGTARRASTRKGPPFDVATASETEETTRRLRERLEFYLSPQGKTNTPPGPGVVSPRQ